MNKVSERVVNQLVSEVEELTGEKFELVNPKEKWWSGLCFDTSALMLWKMLDNFEESVCRTYEHYKNSDVEDRKFYVLHNGLARNIGRMNPNFFKLDDASDEEVEQMMNL